MSAHRNFWATPSGMVAICMIAAVSYFLLMEHREHLFQALPYLILLACPLMHVFMHGSHVHGKHPHGAVGHENADPEEVAYRRGLEDGRRQARDNDHPEGGS